MLSEWVRGPEEDTGGVRMQAGALLREGRHQGKGCGDSQKGENPEGKASGGWKKIPGKWRVGVGRSLRQITYGRVGGFRGGVWPHLQAR